MCIRFAGLPFARATLRRTARRAARRCSERARGHHATPHARTAGATERSFEDVRDEAAADARDGFSTAPNKSKGALADIGALFNGARTCGGGRAGGTRLAGSRLCVSRAPSLFCRVWPHTRLTRCLCVSGAAALKGGAHIMRRKDGSI
jgi:hypothetical protein